MKGKTVFEYWINHIILSIIILTIKEVENNIVPPPWSNPKLNPCASLPGGWQLIYWQPLGKCYKIFQLGFPCPDTKELVPAEHTLKLMEINGIHGECRCPPGTGELSNECYPLFEQKPCTRDEYFGPVDENLRKKTSKTVIGMCKKNKICPDGMAYWPKDDKCLDTFRRGPCPKGKLIISENGLAKCECTLREKLRIHWHNEDRLCYEHYTVGPCTITGHLYLPGDKCGCKPQLPHYYFETGNCYELGTRGPCLPGNIFGISKDDKSKFKHGKCMCKQDYIRWSDNNCYRLYTRGPCDYGKFLFNTTTCIVNNCGKGSLYYPNDNNCYRIGLQGPCKKEEVFIFDFRVRPSIDGLSFNGICGCSGIIKNLDQKCTNQKIDNKKEKCNLNGIGKIRNECYQLYTRGPCEQYHWVEPIPNKEDNAECKCQLLTDMSLFRNDCLPRKSFNNDQSKIDDDDTTMQYTV